MGGDSSNDSVSAGAPSRPRVDLFSDTVTQPTGAMREAIASAPVGDEQLGEDPTVNALQERVADLLGKDAALFMPTGVMCNQVSFAVHLSPGDEVLLEATSHPLTYETGGISALTGAQAWPLAGERGTFTSEQVKGAIRPPGRHFPRSRLVSIEQTTNAGGGACWQLAQIRAVSEVARTHDMAVHIDGARLMNACVATGTAPASYGACADSIWIDLSKGLGAPVGAVLAGSGDFIERAWRFKQRFGGAMRQAGIIAAAGLHALEHHVERLADDHRRARTLAEGLARAGCGLDPGHVETNIVIFDPPDGHDAASFIAAMHERHGVRMSPMGAGQVRAVTHLDVDDEGIEIALAAARDVAASPAA